MKTAQTKVMLGRGFQSRELLRDRHFSEKDQVLTYRHQKVHRYLDMSTRATKEGKRRKQSHPIHNRILFGHANNIVRRHSFEYTSRMRDMLMENLPATM
jgi:hypothetical protein